MPIRRGGSFLSHCSFTSVGVRAALTPPGNATYLQMSLQSGTPWREVPPRFGPDSGSRIWAPGFRQPDQAASAVYPASLLSRSPLAPERGARRPQTRAFGQDGASTAAPMLILAHTGRLLGVTNPSTRPETNSTST